MLNQRSLVIGISLVPAAAIVGLLLIPLWVSVRVESDAGASSVCAPITLCFPIRFLIARSSTRLSFPPLQC